MRKLLGAVTLLALCCASTAIAQTQGATGTKSKPTCKGTTGPVVWYMPANKAYYVRANPHFGKGAGEYMCRVDAIRSIKSAGKTTSSSSSMKSTSSSSSMKSTGSMKSTSSSKSSGAMKSGGAMEQASPMASPQTTPEPSSTG